MFRDRPIQASMSSTSRVLSLPNSLVTALIKEQCRWAFFNLFWVFPDFAEKAKKLLLAFGGTLEKFPMALPEMATGEPLKLLA